MVAACAAGETVCAIAVLCKSRFFFFQAEDGIRDYKVTGVQTCALPIFFFAPPRSTCAEGLGAPDELWLASVLPFVCGQHSASPRLPRSGPVHRRRVE